MLARLPLCKVDRLDAAERRECLQALLERDLFHRPVSLAPLVLPAVDASERDLLESAETERRTTVAWGERCA